YPTFHLHMQTEATDLRYDADNVTGIVAKTPDGVEQIEADLVIACDGRHSTMRDRAGFKVQDIGAPIDVLWMRISRKPGDPGQLFGNMGGGGFLVTIDRNDYY